MAGVDPHATACSLREVVWSARQQQDLAWSHTTAIMATVINLFSKTPVPPDDLHPMREKKPLQIQDL